ncbi:MAG TPA: hypothetical protein VG253_18500 [Streptosporangiaceae bacterium]|jgi:hypothetical protein|nr:hypothetical protein [Streptosporangiaceae bacterium]
MTAAVWANFPLAALIFAAWVGIPLWMTFKRRETHPDYSQARAHFRSKAIRSAADAGARVPAAAITAQLQPTVHTVPGRRHSGTRYPVRTHTAHSPTRTHPTQPDVRTRA